MYKPTKLARLSKKDVLRIWRETLSSPPQLTEAEKDELDKRFGEEDAGKEARQVALKTLTLSGAQVVQMITQASREEALDMARLQQSLHDYSANLKGLAALCDEAALRFTVALAHREDGVELSDLARQQPTDTERVGPPLMRYRVIERDRDE